MDGRSALKSADFGVAAPSRRRTINAFALLVPLLIHIAASIWIALAVPFPSVIDELEHLSFIRAMESAPSLFPDHAKLRVLNPDLRSFGADANYLNHPAPYYIAMAALDRPDLGAEKSVMRLRLIDAALSSLALAVILLTGAAALPDAASRLVFGLAVILFPKTPVVAGLITNDNLGLLATAITFAGLLQLLQKENNAGAILLGLGLALAGWTKLTVAVMLGFAAVFCIVIGLRRGSLRTPRLTVIAAVIAALGAIPTLHNLATLGRPLFVSPTHNAIAAGERPVLSFLDYLGIFFQQLALKWPALEPGNIVQMLTPLFVLLLAAWRIRRAWRAAPSAAKAFDAGVVVAAGFVFAVLPSLLVHAIYGYQAFQAIGDFTSAQARYYYPLWPGVALALALLFATTPAGPRRTVATAVVVLLLATSSLLIALIGILAAGGIS